jgi:hypothetical protein
VHVYAFSPLNLLHLPHCRVRCFLPLPGSTLLRFFNLLWGGRVLTAVPPASCWMSGNASQIAAGVEFPATVGLSALWGAVPEYKPPLLLFKPELKILQQGSRKGMCIVVFWFLVVRTLRFAFNRQSTIYLRSKSKHIKQVSTKRFAPISIETEIRHYCMQKIINRFTRLAEIRRQQSANISCESEI